MDLSNLCFVVFCCLLRKKNHANTDNIEIATIEHTTPTTIGVVDDLECDLSESDDGVVVAVINFVPPDTATPAFPKAVAGVVIAGDAVADDPGVVLAATPSVVNVIVVVGMLPSSGHPDSSQTFDAEQHP